ncbi:MAG: response regulator [Myxococcota bacterium]
MTGGTVLVADDEAGIRRILTRILENDGFQVICAEDGQECVDLFRARSDELVLVILDLTMPRLGGEEVFRELRSISSDLPVILSSGYDEEESTAILRSDGFTRFLRKPYDASTLLEVVYLSLDRPK